MKFSEIEEVRVEKERLIHGRYLLQRPLAQGQVCAVYKGFDQVLQRAIAVKIVPAPHVTSYRDAIKLTAEFSHPNIIGIYDLIDDGEVLYIVQEYVEGDSFGLLLQRQLSPYEVADIGVQMCHALFYASVREVCHGDLTPLAVIRDKRGLLRLNNFALSSDLNYFTAWSVVGGDRIILADRELPWGKESDGRRADDVRAVGLLLYQLLAGRTPGATVVEPPTDGRLRFLRNVPVELCEIIARAVVRQHPQHITTVETLQEALFKILETLQPPEGIISPYQTDDMDMSQTPPLVSPVAPVASGWSERLVTALPSRDGNKGGLLGYRSDVPAAPAYPQPVTPAALSSAAAPSPVTTGADPSVKLVSAQDVYPQSPAPSIYPQGELYQEPQRRRLNLPILITLGLIIFVLFFVVGYFVAHAVFP